MSYWKQTEITDIYGFLLRGTSFGNLRTVSPVRLAGATFSGSSVSTLFYTTTVVGSGTVTQGNQAQTLATGVTANSSAEIMTTAVARYVGETPNQLVSAIQLGDTGTTNNVRRWGAYNGTDGTYYKLSGTTLSVCTVAGGVETAVASSSWNRSTTVPTLTSLNVFEILYTVLNVYFVINGVLAHIASFPSAPWTYNLHFPTFMDNTNSGGSTTNVTMSSRGLLIERLGHFETQPRFYHITGAATSTLKGGPGVLQKVIIGTAATTGTSSLTVYDSTTGSGTVITVITLPNSASAVSLQFDLPFNIGLTIVSAGSAWDVTVIYE
jgi:hypothetical protein